MIDPGRLYDHLQEKGIRFFTGVPDSLMKDFLGYLQDHADAGDHIITANEGLAIALASGHYFRSGKIPFVYLQNSGLGNIINPLSSLADQEMYGVPILIMIGWRGKPGTKDEPQHKKMGRITIPLLEALELPFFVLEENEAASFRLIGEAVSLATTNAAPVVLLVPEQIFETYPGKQEEDIYKLNRERVIRSIIDQLKGDETVICTTGKTGREFYAQNKLAGDKIKKYFLSVGAMGHAGHIALGVAGRDGSTTILLDGDGALLMHMGGLATVAQYAAGNFLHIVLNNGSHESVGGQPTAGFRANLSGIASACGYPRTFCIKSEEALKQWMGTVSNVQGLNFVEIRINRGSRKDLGRPAGEPLSWKKDFMNALKKDPG